MAGINFDIPQTVIENAIAISIAEYFSPEKRDALIRDVVRAHLTVKEHDYDKQTLLNKRVGEMLRKVAAEEVEKKLDSMRPDIERIVGEALGPQFQDSVFVQLRNALKRITVADISINAKIDYD